MCAEEGKERQVTSKGNFIFFFEHKGKKIWLVVLLYSVSRFTLYFLFIHFIKISILLFCYFVFIRESLKKLTVNVIIGGITIVLILIMQRILSGNVY